MTSRCLPAIVGVIQITLWEVSCGDCEQKVYACFGQCKSAESVGMIAIETCGVVADYRAIEWLVLTCEVP